MNHDLKEIALSPFETCDMGCSFCYEKRMNNQDQRLSIQDWLDIIEYIVTLDNIQHYFISATYSTQPINYIIGKLIEHNKNVTITCTTDYYNHCRNKNWDNQITYAVSPHGKEVNVKDGYLNYVYPQEKYALSRVINTPTNKYTTIDKFGSFWKSYLDNNILTTDLMDYLGLLGSKIDMDKCFQMLTNDQICPASIQLTIRFDGTLRRCPYSSDEDINDRFHPGKCNLKGKI